MNKRVIIYLMGNLLVISLALISLDIRIDDNIPLDIHFDSIVVDGHNDTMTKVVDSRTWLPTIDISEETSFHIDIAKLKAGGLNVPFFAAYTGGYYKNTPKSISRTLALINALYWTEKNNSHIFKITTSYKEIKKAVDSDKIAAVPTIEGAYSLDENNGIELLGQYYDLGIRMVGFTWNNSNALGEGANRQYKDPESTPSNGGLTDLGQEIAKEMNRLGMIIDVSHMAESTFWDIIDITSAPIMASHSAMNSLRNHQRNLTDDQLKALAKNGGVVGIIFYPEFLTYEDSNYIKDYVDHIDYAVDLMGIDHVGIGSDFDGGTLPEDLKDCSQLYKITQELIERGYKKRNIEKLLGKNILRVLKQVEKVSDNDLNKPGQGITIKPFYSMGQIISSNTPKLTAEIIKEKAVKIDEKAFKIIVDGIPYEPNYNKETSILSLQLTQPLKEKFHVVTFEATNNRGERQRKTSIFYIDH